jgi:hypothetical protein
MKGVRPDNTTTMNAETKRTGRSAANAKKANSRSHTLTIRQKSRPSEIVRDLRLNLTKLSERLRSFIAFTTINDERQFLFPISVKKV